MDNEFIKHEWLVGYGDYECKCHGIHIKDSELLEFWKKQPHVSQSWAMNMIANAKLRAEQAQGEGEGE